MELNNTIRFAIRRDFFINLLKRNLISTEEYNNIIKIFEKKFSIKTASL
jgi:hypothetical protein